MMEQRLPDVVDGLIWRPFTSGNLVVMLVAAVVADPSACRRAS